MTIWALNPQARLEVRRTGREGHPLLVVDNLLAAPDALVELAAQAPFAPPQGTRYPGLNAPLPEAYLHAVTRPLRPMLQKEFGIRADNDLNLWGFFALATQGPHSLAPIQTIPHQDSSDPMQLALVHYLCAETMGGTGFFRHRATGFEGVDAGRRPDYARIAAAELAQSGGSGGHVRADTPRYEMTDSVDPAFNRLIVYRSHVLHAGLLDGIALSPDPRAGRLTANSFLSPKR